MTILADLRSIRSAISRSSPVTGSLWFSEIYDSISRFSKTLPEIRYSKFIGKMPYLHNLPDFDEATGCCGASPDTVKSQSQFFESNSMIFLNLLEHNMLIALI